jgi:hypothetical protein
MKTSVKTIYSPSLISGHYSLKGLLYAKGWESIPEGYIVEYNLCKDDPNCTKPFYYARKVA